MGGSYRQCTECGKRALSIATRCPGCGREFPAPSAPEAGPTLDLKRFLAPGVTPWVLTAVAVLAVAILVRTVRLPEAQSWTTAADSLVSSSEVAYAMGATARLDTASAAASLGESAGELLVTRDWTNVRRSRSTRADLEAVLMPGDTVLADSLGLGWYRVALDGEVLGYAHRSTLKPAL